MGEAIATTEHTIRVLSAEEVLPRLADYRPHLRAGLAPAGELEVEDLVMDALSSRVQIWLVCRGEECIAAAATKIEVYPLKRVLRIIALSGQDFVTWAADLDALLEWFAQRNKAKEIDAIGRNGLSRLLPKYGFERAYVGMVKEVQ